MRDQGIYYFYHIVHHLEAASLLEQWNYLLKAQLKC